MKDGTMKIYEGDYEWDCVCDFCGNIRGVLVEIKADTFCSHCEYPSDEILICKKCILEAYGLIKEGEDD